MRTSDQARAYGAWARAAGDAVAANARPRAFARGVLTVECASSVWANELTYLGGQLLARMAELDPGHPVQRLRFVSRPAPSPGAARAGQDEDPAAAKSTGRDETLDSADLAAAAESAQAVRDERLRRAILAALGAARPARSPGPRGGPPTDHKT